jgi:hypothetical protein
MPKRIVPLSDMQVSKSKPQIKQVTLFDGGGCFCLLHPLVENSGVSNTDTRARIG